MFSEVIEEITYTGPVEAHMATTTAVADFSAVWSILPYFTDWTMTYGPDWNFTEQ